LYQLFLDVSSGNNLEKTKIWCFKKKKLNMKKSICLAFSFFTIFSLIAVAPSAFAEHGEGGMSATVENAAGSSTPGCEPDCFVPSTIVITVGGTVTWENTDTAAHTSSSGTPTDGPDGVFDSSLIMAGGSYSHTFDTAGTFDYFCMVHPWMEGTVIVEAEAAHGDDHAEEMEEMGHGDDHAAKGIEDISDQFTASVSSGVIHHIGANTDDDTLVVHLFGADDDGELKITLNKDIITPFDDGSYFVLVENEEVDFEQMGRTLHIEYGAGAEIIEIVGSHVVPEFGTIAMIILAVAIVSIIAITAKTRTSLIPKF
jgi:predicted secreted protein with PEFG-CTERM motif